MCGIIGIVGNKPVSERLLQGLRRLEYRGYDSTGMACLSDGKIALRRAEGKISALEAVLNDYPMDGFDGIGHTRWATHGPPTLNNAHPHCTDQLALVHNGIIENFDVLRDSLSAQGITYQSETDSEVVAHLISNQLKQNNDPIAAVQAVLPQLQGAFALAILFADHDGLLIGARRGSPLAIGYGEGEMYLGSDAMALAPFTDRMSFLEEGDWVILTRDKANLFDKNNQPVERSIITHRLGFGAVEKGNYRHFMEKEIHEQPGVLSETLQSLVLQDSMSLYLPDFPFTVDRLPKITASACGTAFYACMVAKYWIEQLSGIAVEVDIASELRYRNLPLPQDGVALFVSQSGETMDSLEALRHAKTQQQKILSIVNVPQSTIMRESDYALLTHAGPEIGVASTKAFTTQLMVLACLAIQLGRVTNRLSADHEQRLVKSLIELPGLMQELLVRWQEIGELAGLLADARAVFYMGRGRCYPIALEGALKLKEISYIHAEGYAAGEMKHGPIALIDDQLPVVMLAPSGQLLEKLSANVQEIVARKGKVILIADKQAADYIHRQTTPEATLIMPTLSESLFAPMLYSLPMQILAYETALIKGTDIDQPRNLAKSVTVE